MMRAQGELAASSRGWRRVLSPPAIGPVLLGAAIATARPLASLAALAALLVTLALLMQPVLGVFLLAWAVPFQSLVATKLGLFRISVTEGLVLLYIAAWALSHRRARPAPHPSLLLLGLLMLAALMLSSLRARQVEPSVKEVLKWAEFLAVYWASAALLQRSRWRWLVVGALLAAAVAEAAVGIRQTVLQDGPSHFLVGKLFMRAYGTFGQPNPFAGYLALFFPIAFSLWAFGDLEARLPWIRSIAGVAAAMLGIALLSSLSRGGLLGAVSATVLVLVLGSRATRQATLAVGTLVLILVLGAGVLFPGRLTERAINTAISAFNVAAVADAPVTPQNWSVLERLSQWHAGWRMFQDNYVFGIGAGNYDQYYPDFSLPKWPQPLGHAHNLYLNIAAESGLLGLAAYALFVVGVVRLGRRAACRDDDPAARALAIGVLGGLAAYSVHSVFDVLFVHGVGVLLGLLLALLETASIPPQSMDRSHRRTTLAGARSTLHPASGAAG